MAAGKCGAAVRIARSAKSDVIVVVTKQPNQWPGPRLGAHRKFPQHAHPEKVSNFQKNHGRRTGALGITAVEARTGAAGCGAFWLTAGLA